MALRWSSWTTAPAAGLHIARVVDDRSYWLACQVAM